METKSAGGFDSRSEGAVIVALDSRKDGLLYGAVELRGGGETWLDYELEFTPTDSMVSLFREADDTPVLEYCVRGRRVDTVTRPERLLLLWNRGRRALAVDGEPLSPGEMSASVPQDAVPWLLRFAGWLPGME